MSKKFYCLFVFLLATTGHAAETCEPVNLELAAQELSGGEGSLSLSGLSCTQGNNSGTVDIAATTTATFNDHRYADNPFTTNGTFILGYSYATTTGGKLEVRVVYDGGPVIYAVEDESVSVTYQEVMLVYDDKIQFVRMEGSVKVEGETYPVAGLDPRLFRIF